LGFPLLNSNTTCDTISLWKTPLDFSEMIPQLKKILNDNHSVLPFLDRLEEIFRLMDSHYKAMTQQYGFLCMGCDENCCLTLFYHHTLLECLYLHVGYRKLENIEKSALQQSAVHFDHHQQVTGDRPGQSFRRMCPLNINNKCTLYEYRPMICRLHGIPYELHAPDNTIIRGSGCKAFEQQCHPQSYIAFDRTPLYAAMAKLESDIKQVVVFNEKIKLTIAQIVLLFD